MWILSIEMQDFLSAAEVFPPSGIIQELSEKNTLRNRSSHQRCSRKKLFLRISRLLWTSSLYYFIQSFIILDFWILPMARHHADNTLLTSNLLFDSDGRQWSYPLMILLYCLWAKSNCRTCGQFECDVTLFSLWVC